MLLGQEQLLERLPFLRKAIEQREDFRNDRHGSGRNMVIQYTLNNQEVMGSDPVGC